MQVRVKRANDVTVTKSLCAPEKRIRRDVLVGAPISAEEEEARLELADVLEALKSQPNGDKYTYVKSCVNILLTSLIFSLFLSFSLISILSSTKQVVAGLKYVINGKYSTTNGPDLECTTNIWSRPWLGKKEVNFECDNQNKHEFTINKPVNDENKREKRHAGLGAPQTASEEEARQELADVLDALKSEPVSDTYTWGSLLNYSPQSRSNNIVFINSLISILSSTKQVVAGYKYVIRGKYSTTKGADQECTTEIWSRLWLGKKDVTFECDNQTKHAFTINKPVNDDNSTNQRKRRDVLVGAPISADEEEARQELTDVLETLKTEPDGDTYSWVSHSEFSCNQKLI